MSITWLVAVCLATALAIRLLQHCPRLVVAATGIGTALFALVLLTATDEPANLIGRTIMLDLPERIFLWPAIGVTAALAFFGPLTFRRPDEASPGLLSDSQNAFFFLGLAPLVLSLAFDSFPLAVFFWSLSLLLLVLLAQPRREGRVGGAAQFLLLVVVSEASLLISNRFFDLYPLTPENSDLARSAFLFLAWGLGVLLAVVPLHIWVGPLADEMPILSMAFLVSVVQPVGLWLLLQLMREFLWLTEKAPLLDALLLGGLVTAPGGALLALAERRRARFVTFLSLVSLGHILIGLGLGTRLGLAAAVLAMINRAFGVALVAGGLALGDVHPALGRRSVAILALLAGGLALAGMPPLMGITSRWGLYSQLAGQRPEILGLLLVSNAAVLFAVLRMVNAVIHEPIEMPAETVFNLVPSVYAIVVVLLVAVLFFLALFPQLLADPVIAILGQADYLK
jgi:formate hydrogenlyase subunit 3/multisubunit Na+/H+ antiporter MnhD subunit